MSPPGFPLGMGCIAALPAFVSPGKFILALVDVAGHRFLVGYRKMRGP